MKKMCECCGLKPVLIHIKRKSQNGVVYQSMCEDCARASKIPGITKVLDDLQTEQEVKNESAMMSAVVGAADTETAQHEEHTGAAVATITRPEIAPREEYDFEPSELVNCAETQQQPEYKRPEYKEPEYKQAETEPDAEPEYDDEDVFPTSEAVLKYFASYASGTDEDEESLPDPKLAEMGEVINVEDAYERYRRALEELNALAAELGIEGIDFMTGAPRPGEKTTLNMNTIKTLDNSSKAKIIAFGAACAALGSAVTLLVTYKARD